MAQGEERAAQRKLRPEFLYLKQRQHGPLRIHWLAESSRHLEIGMDAQGVADVIADAAALEQCRGFCRTGADEDSIGVDSHHVLCAVFSAQPRDYARDPAA